MPLVPGTRLGPYEVTAQIGVGGMGEVYQATDTVLGRQVAIKVLPDLFAQDPERLARFEREAKTLASLNHPNIAIIHGLERGPAEAGHYVRALVMELVEGPTLADLISDRSAGPSGPAGLPVEEVLAIAKQIAEALEAAHEQGIVHRDLKPANIKVRPDGRVKVLDFGLAKALAQGSGIGDQGSVGVSQSPTITTPAMTQAGMILGTAAYMSPEQAKGRATDKRGDVWAFGCVLYEMLTGTRAFDGEDVSETLADVMRVEPAWEQLPEGLSPALVTFLKRCLRKDPRERVRDIGDVRLALAGAFDTMVPRAGIVHATPAAPRPLWRRALPLVVTALVVAAAALGAGWVLRPAEPRPVIRSVHALPDGRRLRGTNLRVVAISPDGRHLVYNGAGGLYLRTMDALGDRLIPGTERNLSSPTFSPDGQSLAFYQDGQLRRIAIVGGASVALTAAVVPLGLSWETDGTLLFGQALGGGNGLWQVSENGGEPQRLLSSENDELMADPQRLPGGDWVLFTLGATDRRTEGDIVVQSPSSGERRVLRTGGVSGRYLSSGHLVYFYEGVLYAVPFDVEKLEVTGGPVPVVEGVRPVTGTRWSAHFDVSSTGTLAFVPGPARASGAEYSLAVADRGGAVTRAKIPPGPFVHTRATRDGKRLAIDTEDGKEAIVWIQDLSGTSAMRRLTFGGRNRLPIWSPDGQRVAFQSDREGDLAIFAQRADGTGGVERLTKPEKGDAHVPESWSLDGKYISFSVVKGSTYSVWVLSLEDGKSAPFGEVQSAEPPGSVFSPDGRWIAYHSRPPGEDTVSPAAGVFVEPFPPTGARYQAPRVNLDFQPVWSADGSELFYVPSTSSGRLAAVRVMTTSGVTFDRPESLPFVLTAGRLSGATRAFDVLPEGTFVGPVAGLDDDIPGPAAAPEVHLVFNWFEELKRLAPTK